MLHFFFICKNFPHFSCLFSSLQLLHFLNTKLINLKKNHYKREGKIILISKISKMFEIKNDEFWVRGDGDDDDGFFF